MADSESKLHGTKETVLERQFASVVLPFQQFVTDQKNASILLLICTLFALIIANSPWAHAYEVLVGTPFGLKWGEFEFTLSFRHWVNDGLMALFFFVIGLEIKRELLVGELREASRSVPIIAAALGGMVVPALIYYAIMHSSGDMQGWAIPMATDTAFAIGILALLGNRLPGGLTTFLLALAIIDDMGAVLVIAFFYSNEISVTHLIIAAGLIVVLVLVNQLGIRRPIIYIVIGGMVWFAMHGSGVHSTISGILVALTVPARPVRDSTSFLRKSRKLLDRYETIEQHEEETSPILAEPEKQEVVEKLQETAHETTTPLQLWERALEHPIALFVLPLFALTNAGISIEAYDFKELLIEPLALAIILGLVLGKLIGISLASYAALRIDWVRLPGGMTKKHIPGLALLGGMGFTMSVFIAGLGFGQEHEKLIIAKLGILMASLIAGIGGYVWLRMVERKTTNR